MKNSMSSRCAAATVAAAFALVANVAKADDVFWNPAVTEGLFTDGSSWVGGVAPGDADRGVFSNATEAVTVSFPAGTTAVAESPLFCGAYASTHPDWNKLFDVTFDTTGKTVFFGKPDGTADWSLFNLKHSSGNSFGDRIYSCIRAVSPSSGRTDFLTLSDTVLRVRLDDQGVASFAATGGSVAMTNGTFAVNFPANGVAYPSVTVALTNLTFSAKGVSQFPGTTFTAKECTFTEDFRSLTLAPDSGAYPTGRAVMSLEGVEWRSEGQNNITITVGAKTSASTFGRLAVSGASTVYLKNTKTGTGARNSCMNIANTSATGEVDISGTSSFSLIGASGYDNEGMIWVGKGGSSKGLLAVRDDATLYAYNDIIVATGSDATGAFCLSNNAVATARRRVYLGNTSSMSARVVVADSAKLVTPLVETRVSTSENFVTNSLELAGGTLETAQIVGADQMALLLSGTPTLRATAASTSAAPLLSGATAAAQDGTVLVIDTQSYATYIDQDFGASVTVVKRGSGTLYVKNSNHAKTVIEAGTVSFYDGATHFGDGWDVADGATPPYTLDGATAAGDTFLASFSTEAAALAFIAEYEKDYAPALGWGYAFTATEDLGTGLWGVTATAAVATDANLAWSGADGDSWASTASWTPAQVPTHNDNATVSGAAEIAMPASARAKTLTISGDDDLAFSGDSELKIAESLSISGDTAGAKVFTVDGGDSLAVTVTNLSFTTVAMAKDGAGTLSFEIPVIGVVRQIGAATLADSANLSVREGTMRIKGAGVVEQNGWWGSKDHPAPDRQTTRITGTKKVGGATLASAPALAELVFDKCGGHGAITVGGGNADVARLVVSNGAVVGQSDVTIDAASGKTAELLLASNGKVAANAGYTITLGASAANRGTARMDISDGGILYAAGGGNRNGALTLGGGIDARVHDGGEIKFDQAPSVADTRAVGWIRGNSRASGVLRIDEGGTFSFCGGYSMNNSSLTATAETNFKMSFDGGVFKPLLANASDSRTALECRYLVMRSPEYQGLVATDGGMNVDMSACSRYTINCPVRGDGALVKTGSGVLVMGTGRTFASGYTGTYYKDATVTNSADVVESGVVTVQNAGGVVVREGSVELETGATDAASAFTVEAGATLDLAGNSVSVGKVAGAGTVSGGTLSAVTLVASDGDVPTFTDVAFAGSVTVDFGCDAEGPADKSKYYKVATLGANVTGKLTDGMLLDAANTGNVNLHKARIAVDGSGNVTAKPATGNGFTIVIK